jgi:hypothetical protein
MYANYNWNAANNIWIGSYKQEYAYDSNGNQTMQASYEWDNTNNIWIGLYGKYVYVFDDNGNRTMSISYEWDYDNNIWVETSKYKIEYEYDSNKNITQQTFCEWSYESNTWNCYGKYEYDYDYSYSKTDLLFPTNNIENYNNPYWKEDYYMNNMRTERRGYWKYEEVWGLGEVETYYWSSKDIEQGISETVSQSFSIKIYPNPVSNILHIETENANSIPEIKIYSIQGVLLLSTKGNQIDVSSLSSGIYIARIDKICRKIIKQ